jgi:hypothetical protein
MQISIESNAGLELIYFISNYSEAYEKSIALQ